MQYLYPWIIFYFEIHVDARSRRIRRVTHGIWNLCIQQWEEGAWKVHTVFCNKNRADNCAVTTRGAYQYTMQSWWRGSRLGKWWLWSISLILILPSISQVSRLVISISAISLVVSFIIVQPRCEGLYGDSWWDKKGLVGGTSTLSSCNQCWDIPPEAWWRYYDARGLDLKTWSCSMPTCEGMLSITSSRNSWMYLYPSTDY